MKTLKQYPYFVLTIVTFIGIVLYELNISPAQLLTQLFADSQSFAILVKDDEFVLLDQKTRFIINQDETERQFIFLNYDTGMINGVFDIHSINELTVIQGHRGNEMGLKGLRTGFLGGFLLFGALSLAEDADPFMALLPAFVCGTIDGITLGVVSNLIGSRMADRTTYKVASNHWQFADINNLILNP